MLANKKVVFFILAAIIALWVIFCYDPFLLWFQNDDFSHILLSKQGVLFQKNSFRPVCDLSVMFDYWLWGLYAPGYHITNLVLHIICTIILFLFAKRLFAIHYAAACRPFTVLICCLLFFAYPFHSEACFWILGRSAILGAIFSLLFLLFFLKERKSALNTGISLAAYAIALLTYESTWVLPVIAIVLSKPQEGRPFFEKVKPHYALAAIFGLYLFARFRVNHALMGSYEGENFLQFNAAALFNNYFKLMARSFTAYSDAPFALRAGFFLLSCVLLWATIRQSKTGAGRRVLLCFLISLLPYLSLGIDTHGTEGERFLYLPSVFAIIWATVVISAMQEKYARFAISVASGVLFTAQLYTTAVNYSFAGGVVKQTVTQLAAMPAGSHIVMEGLPKSQHGALIFGGGLQDANVLFADGKNISIDIINWRYELSPLQQPYKALVRVRQWQGVPNAQLVFTDSALMIYK